MEGMEMANAEFGREQAITIKEHDAGSYVCERVAIPHIPRVYSKSDYSIATAVASYCLDLEQYGIAVKGLEVRI